VRAYVDSDILIWHLRGETRAAALLRRLSADRATDLWIGALQRAEIVFFMRPEEATATRAFLTQFKTEPVSQPVVDHAADLYRRWHPSHGIDANDAMLAATVALTGGTIYTQNRKHYPMPEIAALKGW
jgi:Predicted nucleic acid-binding protein, contains PIN domain